MSSIKLFFLTVIENNNYRVAELQSRGFASSPRELRKLAQSAENVNGKTVIIGGANSTRAASGVQMFMRHKPRGDMARRRNAVRGWSVEGRKSRRPTDGNPGCEIGLRGYLEISRNYVSHVIIYTTRYTYIHTHCYTAL